MQLAVKLSKFLCIKVPDYLKDKHDIHGKLAILEQHQIELRENYLSSTVDNGLGPEAKSLRTGVKELTNNTTSTMAKLGNDEGTNHDDRQPLINGGGKHVQCGHEKDENKLAAIQVSLTKILENIEDSVVKDQRKAEWHMLGALIDRILLILLLAIATITTLYIYVIAPVSIS